MIRKLDRSVISLVMQTAPGYRNAFHIFLTVAKGLMLYGKIHQKFIKYVATLYEFWIFLKLDQILGREYPLNQPKMFSSGMRRAVCQFGNEPPGRKGVRAPEDHDFA